MSYSYPHNDRITDGKRINHGEGLKSNNQRIKLHVTSTGDLELLGDDDKKLWFIKGKNIRFLSVASRDKPPSFPPNDSNCPYTLVCQDDGNLVNRNTSNKIIWATNTRFPFPTSSLLPDFPYGNTLPANGSLGRGFGLRSQSGNIIFYITYNGDILLVKLQNDAKLTDSTTLTEFTALINNGERLWSVTDKNASFVMMQTDGIFRGYDTAGNQISWGGLDATAGTGPYKLVCENDGRLVVYANGVNVWVRPVPPVPS